MLLKIVNSIAIEGVECMCLIKGNTDGEAGCGYKLIGS